METRRYRLLVAVLCHWLALILAAPAVLAQGTNIDVQLVAPNVVAPGEEANVVLVMTPKAGWHGYWKNPGDAGVGMRLDWQAPESLGIGEPRYPVPETLLISGLMNHVYEGRYGVVMPLSVAKDASPGAATIALEAQWLACTDEICVPERGALSAQVTIAADPDEAARAGNPDPGPWLARLPAPLSAPVSHAVDRDTIRFGIPLPADLTLTGPHLFLAQDKIVDYAAPQHFSRRGDLLIVELRRKPDGAEIPASGLDAVLRLDDAGNGLAIESRTGEVPQAGEPLGEKADAPRTSALPWLLLAALAGGLLLNVMPCVFPILSLKALSLARAGESERHARIEGLAYAAGVIVACLALGALLLALRAAGEEVGWAFQLQEPAVIAALLLLAVALTANFLGAFEFAVPGFATAGSPQGAFATGLLAAFVATPCTGPFMAGAMGAALLLPVPSALALFAALGLGIALPFLAIAFVPALRRRLPRPGPWMVTFRRWMALPMGLTALALAWLAWRIGGTSFALTALAFAAAIALVLARMGGRQRAGLGVDGLQVAMLGAILVAAAFALPVTVEERTPEDSASLLATEPYSETRLAEARAAGKPVFAWFTADWCLTCKVNERVAIERAQTKAAFEKAGVVVLRGDWTRRDPEITRYLTEQGAAGVPLYVWYPANGGEGEKLPQVLTPGTLAEKAAAGAAAD
ncbi:thiol:disulfide interchange protein [Novosphingobium sp. PC22D]|uniref:protein-disulfide reductase DsbD family protein n=1 Tax=Novosphingobium sp. PC22D TaxID=1962403 RepID=UPI000BF232BF|nr:thioredoxin family protein [Novosphingobium sp. PC22D]PEQ14728.1 thiol:disulfide interchange protein [Novosphingobium sp. PC22D]